MSAKSPLRCPARQSQEHQRSRVLTYMAQAQFSAVTAVTRNFRFPQTRVTKGSLGAAECLSSFLHVLKILRNVSRNLARLGGEGSCNRVKSPGTAGPATLSNAEKCFCRLLLLEFCSLVSRKDVRVPREHKAPQDKKANRARDGHRHFLSDWRKLPASGNCQPVGPQSCGDTRGLGHLRVGPRPWGSALT